MFRHPKYYKELKEFGKRGDRGKPTAASPDTEQAISLRARDGECERAPAPGHKQGSSDEQQADKAQATKSQAAGGKAQAPSSEGQASSHKHRDPL